MRYCLPPFQAIAEVSEHVSQIPHAPRRSERSDLVWPGHFFELGGCVPRAVSVVTHGRCLRTSVQELSRSFVGPDGMKAISRSR